MPVRLATYSERREYVSAVYACSIPCAIELLVQTHDNEIRRDHEEELAVADAAPIEKSARPKVRKRWSLRRLIPGLA